MNNEKEFDDVFRKGLEDPVYEAGYREEDWGSLEQMLDARRKSRGMVFWLPVLGSAAALLLLFLGWWIFRPKTVDHPQDYVRVKAIPKKEQGHTGTGGGIRQITEPKQNTALPAGYANTPVGKGSSKSNAFSQSSAAGSRRISIAPIPIEIYSEFPPSRDDVPNNIQSTETLAAMHESMVLRGRYKKVIDEQFPINTPGVSPLRLSMSTSSATSSSKNINNPKNGFRPQYAISLIGAPDLNGVGGFSQSKVGTNLGLLFSAGVLSKFTISTGVIYSAKPYNTSFEQYHTPYKFPVTPTNVTADCRMFDIPLDIDYLVYNKHQNKISFGTGLSSYIMVHQNYVFNYAYPYTIGPTNYTVKNNGKYFFGVVNLNATYEHQLNSKLGISVMPYLKLPLTDVGYSEVRLQSTGIALGLSWNLNSITKPTGK